MYTSVGSGISGSAYTAVTQLYSWTQPIKKQAQLRADRPIIRASATQVGRGTMLGADGADNPACTEEADVGFLPRRRHRRHRRPAG